MRITIDSVGIRADDDAVVIDDHLVLVSAAQAARSAVTAFERGAALLPHTLRPHAETVVRALQGDRLCTERTLADLAALSTRLADVIEAGTIRIAVPPEHDGGQGHIEHHYDDVASECRRIDAALGIVRSAVALALDCRRAVRLLGTMGAGTPPARERMPVRKDARSAGHDPGRRTT